ncbi:MAG: F0F1 ATP synthase subunit delta [Chloroflexi bacterium]|nr:MAG: F0F1 ATP synthase subunit delta [Chloroflexota bacterium]RLC93691.1 MAG: F0F1 ATP synthase subunit delta [Chloroflexota bacterium]
MAKGVSAKRHAQAVFQIALETGQLDRWQRDLEVMADTLAEPGLVALLENPKVKLDEKREVLEKVLPDIAPAAMNLAHFLVAKNRLRILPGMLTEYERLLNAHYGREVAEVSTAVPISDEEKERVRKRLAELLGKELVIKVKVDPDVMGGLVARVGDTLVDGSVRTRLRDLRQSLVHAR